MEHEAHGARYCLSTHTPGLPESSITSLAQGSPKDVTQPETDKPGRERTPGCARRELGVKVEGVVGLGHSRLERGLDLTPVELLQGGVYALITMVTPQPASSPDKKSRSYAAQWITARESSLQGCEVTPLRAF